MDALQHGRQLVARQADIEPHVIERPSAGGRICFEKVGSSKEAWGGTSVADRAVEACEVLISQDQANVGEGSPSVAISQSTTAATWSASSNSKLSSR